MRSDLTPREISIAVERSLVDRGWTIADCCNAFNMDVKAGRPLQKDFVHRVKKCHFEVVTPRVVSLCEFLGVNLRQSISYRLQHEIDAVERAVLKNPSLEGRVKELLKNIAEIAEA